MDQQAAVAAMIALSAACGFAVSNALQHRAAGGVPRGESTAGRVLLHLTRNPWWLLGTGLSFVGMLLHATALRWGSIDRTLGNNALPDAEDAVLVRKPPAPHGESPSTNPARKP